MTGKKFRSKIYKKSFTLTYRILTKLKKGMYQEQIARQMSIPKQNIYYHIKRLEKEGLIHTDIKTIPKIYKITEKGNLFLKNFKQSKKFSLSMKEKTTRLHNLALKFPILKDNPNANWDKKIAINNWVKKYSTISFPIGMTIEKTPTHIIAYFHQFHTSQETFLSDLYSWVLKGIQYVYYYLMHKKRIRIDPFDFKVIRVHVASEVPELDGKADRNKTVELLLKRKSRFIKETDMDAKAWMDSSLGSFEVETNDMIYKEKFLMMPETVHKMNTDFIPALEKLTQQINLHLEVQEQQLMAVKQLRKQISKMDIKKEISDLVKVVKELKKK